MNDNGPQYPAVDSTVGVIPLPDGRVQIRTPTSRFTIGKEAQLAVDLVQLCDGSRHLDEVIESLLRRGHSEAHARELCRVLARRGVLVPDAPLDCEDVLLAHICHFARHTGNGAAAVPELATGRPVQVCGSGRLAESVRADLTRLNIPFTATFDPTSPHVSLIVACSDYETHDGFRERNRAAVNARRPIVFACITETSIRVGPLVVPKESACFECFHHRLRANLSFREEFDAFLKHNTFLEESGIDSRAGIYAQVGSGFVCAQVAHFLLSNVQHCLIDRLVEVSPVAVELISSRLLKLPRCEVCGHVDDASPPAARDWI